MNNRNDLTALSIKLFRRLGDECDDSPAPNYEEDNYDAGFLAGLSRAQEIIRAEQRAGRCVVTPPRDLADAQNRLDRIREYAQKLRSDADVYLEYGAYGTVGLLRDTAAALERIIGGES